MEKRVTKQDERRIALFERDGFIWLLSMSSTGNTSVVHKQGKQMPPVLEPAGNTGAAGKKFRQLIREAPQYAWRIFYRGPVLNG
jgi:hypothetical protein